MTKSYTFLTAACLIASVSIAQAQPAAPKPTDAQRPPAATAPPSAAGGMVMGKPGAAMPMMGGDMGQSMQSMMPMMRQMMSHHDMMRMDGPMGMMSPARIEGRIAFMKTELKITESQNQAWTGYAEILRSEAKAMAARREVMMGGAAASSAPDRADQRVKRMAEQLDAAKAAAGALRSLYGVLDDAQKKTADELFAPAMGRM